MVTLSVRENSPVTMSFAELSNRRRVTPEDLVQTFKEYAHSGARISANIVNDLIHRVRRRISRPQFKHLAEAAAYGVTDQIERGFKTDAAEYQQVLNLVQRKLAR